MDQAESDFWSGFSSAEFERIMHSIYATDEETRRNDI